MALSLAEKDLLDRCCRGDEAAWAVLYRSHAPDVSLFIGGVLGQRQDVEDLVHRVFLELLSSLPRFRGEASLSTWLHRIATHVVKKEARSAARHRRKVQALTEHVSSVGTTDGTNRREARDELAVVEKALAALDLKFRMVWVMIELQGLSVDETASALRMRTATVRSRHQRARARILESMRALGSEQAAANGRSEQLAGPLSQRVEVVR